MSKGFAIAGRPRGSEIHSAGATGVQITASATPHTKGSWVQIAAATARDAAGIWVSFDENVGASTFDTSTLLDIGFGAVASETVVVSNIPIGAWAVGLSFFLPLDVPTGTRIAGRIQSAVISKVVTLAFVLETGSKPGMWAGYSISETIGVDTATSGPTTGDLADNAWDEAIASTANAYRGLTLHLCMPPGNNAVAGGTKMNVDVGMGAAGSEVVLGTWRATLSTSEILVRYIGPQFLVVAIDAGSRLAIRKNGTSDMSGALIAWR